MEVCKCFVATSLFAHDMIRVLATRGQCLRASMEKQQNLAIYCRLHSGSVTPSGALHLGLTAPNPNLRSRLPVKHRSEQEQTCFARRVC